MSRRSPREPFNFSIRHEPPQPRLRCGLFTLSGAMTRFRQRLTKSTPNKELYQSVIHLWEHDRKHLHESCTKPTGSLRGAFPVPVAKAADDCKPSGTQAIRKG